MTTEGTDSLTLSLVSDGLHDAEMDVLGDGAYEIRTIGVDPQVLTCPIAAELKPDIHRVLAFEYFCPTGLGPLQVFFGPDPCENRSVTGDVSMSEGWVQWSLDLSEDESWGMGVAYLRIDFGNRADRKIQVRNLQLRQPTTHELELAANREAKEKAEAELHAAMVEYLNADYSSSVDRVSANADTVRVTGTVNSAVTEVHLCEVILHESICRLQDFVFTVPIDGAGDFDITLPRFIERNGENNDRILSKWALARKQDDEWQLLSAARYTDEIEPLHDYPALHPRCKKGLGGFAAGRGNVSDLDDLGIGSVTVNIWISAFLRLHPEEGTVPHEFNGRTYYVVEDAILKYDETMRVAAERDLVVLAIVLVGKVGAFEDEELQRLWVHPDCHPSGVYSMPNLTTPEGVALYAATLDFLAQRYSRSDKKFGRIHHWIMHNEVDAGWVWTNCGEKTPLLYMDLYHKSMRMAHNIARKYSAHAKAFISLTHYWNWTVDKKFHLPKELLTILLQFSKLEGDFEWAVAQHPYPQSLFEPRTWEDDKCDFTFESELITYRNLEVLDAWMKDKSTWFNGERQRTLHLTEQGLNSKDYSDEAMKDQAAGMAYAWKKVMALDSIEAFQYHNWTDSRGEGGLRIGLRMFPGDEFNAAPKPIWHLYAKLETAEEDAACEEYRKHIGIDDWSEIQHTGGIAEDPLFR